MNKHQIELGLETSHPATPATPAQRRRSRAHWWFNQMRAVVDKALDWQPAPPARPEQIYLTLARGR